jgi:hypothetical protein
VTVLFYNRFSPSAVGVELATAAIRRHLIRGGP